MKSFKTYLNEQEIPKEMMEVLERIKKNSKPFLKMITNDPLKFSIFSGRSEKNTFIRTIRKNRIPKGFELSTTELIDDYFEKKFGIRFRQQSIFVVGAIKKNRIHQFGKLHLIFPIGKFKILWSPEIIDLNLIPLSKKRILEIGTDQEIEEFLESLTFMTKNIKTAILSGNEILITGNEYYAISETIIKKWGFSAEEFLKKLKNIL